MTLLPVGIDDGAYLGADKKANKPFKELNLKGLCSFFICKGAQNYLGQDPNDLLNYINTIDNIAAARGNGVEIIGTYYWFWPSWDMQQQIAYYKAAIELEDPDFIAVDIEQTDGLPGSVLSERAQALCDGLHALFPHLPLFVYTSKHIINDLMPQANAWIGKYLIWICSWPGYEDGLTVKYLTPEEIRAIPDGYEPNMPDGWVGSEWVLWQFATWPRPDFVRGLPYYDHQYDFNLFNGTIEEFKLLCGIAIVPPPPPPQTNLEKWAWMADAWMRSHGYNGIHPDGTATILIPVVTNGSDNSPV